MKTPTKKIKLADVAQYLFDNPQASDAIKRLLLTTRQRIIVEYMRENPKGLTARDVADRFDTSIYSASVVLKRLADTGYLARFDRVAATGGSEYLYTAKKSP